MGTLIQGTSVLCDCHEADCDRGMVARIVGTALVVRSRYNGTRHSAQVPIQDLLKAAGLNVR